MVVNGEIVGTLPAHPALLKVVATYVHDPVVVPVTLQEFGTELEEGRIGQCVVLQDDPLLFMAKEPGNSGGAGELAAEVFPAIEPGDCAGPVDRLGELPGLAAEFDILRYPIPGSVSRNIKPRGAGRADGLEDLPRRGRTVKDQE